MVLTHCVMTGGKWLRFGEYLVLIVDVWFSECEVEYL